MNSFKFFAISLIITVIISILTALAFYPTTPASPSSPIRIVPTNTSSSPSVTMSKAILETFALGRQPYKTFDPFLFCMHHRDEYPAGNKDMAVDPSLLRGRDIGSDFSYKNGWSMYHGTTVPGFPSHPHRGFETITVVDDGLIDHSDSLGCTARFGRGDTQWVTTGKGLQHSEMFPLLNMEKKNPLELFQVWLNLPRKNKMCEPYFTMFWNEKTPVVELKDSHDITSTVKVVAGKFNAVTPLPSPPDSWASEADSDVAVWWIKIPAKGTVDLPPAAADSTTRALYFVGGSSIKINDGEPLPVRSGVRVKSTAPLKLEALEEDAEVLLLQGRPIGEPVAQHGPFVMNTREEIMDCFSDYRRTQFGGWQWPSHDHTHSRETKRHAVHLDGTREDPSKL